MAATEPEEPPAPPRGYSEEPPAPPRGYVEVTGGSERRGRWSALVARLAPVIADQPRLGRPGLYALIGVCVVAVVATAWFLLRARPEVEPAPRLRSDANASTATAPDPAGAVPAPPADPPAPPAPPGTPGEVTVHVGGDVKKPGVITLPAGARVTDAIEAAGGTKAGADTNTLNLARPLTDGEQILVGVTPPPAPPGQPAGPGGPGTNPAPIDLNTATAEQLQELPGIGPVLAQRIVEHRTENGGFTAVEQLNDVSGIGEKRFAELRDRVRVGGGR